MRDSTAALAQAITWAGSKQTYYTARLMIDRGLMDDFFRAYAYFRWVDDVVDGTASDDVLSRFDDDCVCFVERQGTLIDKLYRNERPNDLTPEEEIVAVLVSHDSGENSGLQSFIRNMFAVIKFDALRRGRLISQRELAWYTSCLARSVTDGLQYFVGNGHPYPAADNRYLAATAAHIAHLLRDMVQDTTDGYVNIPREYLEAHDIDPDDFGSSPFRAWVQQRVTQARQCFREGKRYLGGLAVLRCRIAGYWYCARFEGILDTIERDGYRLRATYNKRHRLSTWLDMAWLGLYATLQHMTGRDQYGTRYLHRSEPRSGTR